MVDRRAAHARFAVAAWRAVAVAVLFTLAGCSQNQGFTPCNATAGCDEGQRCVAGRCRPKKAIVASGESVRKIFEASAFALVSSKDAPVRGQEAADLTLGRSASGDAVLLTRYHVDVPAGATLEAAFVVLDPLSGAPSAARPIPIEVAEIRTDWDASTASWGRQPELGLIASAGFARSQPPAPLRVDVTHIAQTWASGAADRGIAILADAADPMGAIYTTGLTGGQPPRLEIYLRQGP